MSRGTRYKIGRLYSLHTGGTKFYQIIWIYPEHSSTGPSVCITHWGPSAGHIFPKPGSHGQYKITRHASSVGAANQAGGAKTTKSRRGYDGWKEEEEFKTETELSMWLTSQFGVEQGAKIALDLALDADTVVGAIPEEKLKPAPKEKKSEPEIDRGTEWGSW